MAKGKKARVEGEDRLAAHLASAASDTIKARAEPKVEPKKGDGETLRRIVEDYKAKFPDQWEAIALCPTLHGIEIMADALL